MNESELIDRRAVLSILTLKTRIGARNAWGQGWNAALEAVRGALAAAPHKAAEPVDGEVERVLFRLGKFTLASGKRADWKIDCDALTPSDWAALAWVAATTLPPFGRVEGVPSGGLPFAKALSGYTDATSDTLLIAEDVVTTGGSMERHRADREAIGIAAFARGAPPAWVTPLFSLATIGQPRQVDQDVVERIGKLLGMDPICMGRVSADTIEAIAALATPAPAGGE